MKGVAPTLDSSTIVLLGISAATTVTARSIDISDAEKRNWLRHQNDFGKNFFLDIVSDETGPSIHRFQTIVFNAVFGIWFIYAVQYNMYNNNCTLYLANQQWFAECTKMPLNYLIPPIAQNNLILLGVSSAMYAALKTTENRTATIQAENKKSDESTTDTYKSSGSNPSNQIINSPIPQQGEINHP